MLKRLWPFGRRHARCTGNPWDLMRPLLEWSTTDPFTIGDSVCGTLILGRTGSGKTSGTGALMGRSMLAAGYGGLVLTAKADERRLWERYCAETNRLDDLVIFGPLEQPARFNFLDFELNRSGEGAGLTENVCRLLSSVAETTGRASGGGGGGGGGGMEDGSFWQQALRQMQRNAIDLCSLAWQRVSVPDLYRLVTSAPSSLEEVQSDGWRQRSWCFESLRAADQRAKTRMQERDLEVVASYWLQEFPALSPKTRSVIVSSFTAMSDVLNRGLLRDLLCSETTITPDAVLEGKVILLDLPLKEFGEVGLMAQTILKHCFQRALERRDVTRHPRPVFLWADEAQHFITSEDAMFQTTCRSARVATVLLSQNISNFYAALGGEAKGKAQADSLFANLSTKVLHASDDPITNEWASSLIGRSKQLMLSGGTSHKQPAHGISAWLGEEDDHQLSSSFSEQYQFELQPTEFLHLRTGGPLHQRMVDAIVVRSGLPFRATGRMWCPASVRQRP